MLESVIAWIGSFGANDWIAAGSIAIVFATIALGAIAWVQIQTSRAELRAYVKMSHLPPGLDTETLTIRIRVKNFGKTPARVTDLLIKPLVLTDGTTSLPDPDYSVSEKEIGESKQAFLVTNDKIFVTRKLPLSPADLAAIKDGLRSLYVYGYVDYIDAFKRRHRGGYGRVFVPSLDTGPPQKRNNLNVVADGRYNYDRPRKPGEGNDWD